MVGENGTPETPEWTPTPHPAPEFEAFWEDHHRDMRDAEYRRAFLDAEEHIERGSN